MLENCKSAKERWGGVHDIIDRWLHERQEMIVLLCEINGLPEISPKPKQVEGRLQAFCQILVDYVSAGHFEVYEQLMKEGMEFDDGGVELAQKLYPAISKTTEFALDFNDKYETPKQLDTLNQDLGNLGEMLETRFELEDQMIDILHMAHKELVA